MTARDPSLEVWRGQVNAWNCDEMGHMNVRFYVSRFMEGLGGLALRLGLPDAFQRSTNATLLVRDHHLRFLKEAHAGALGLDPLHEAADLLGIADGALAVQLGETADRGQWRAQLVAGVGDEPAHPVLGRARLFR